MRPRQTTQRTTYSEAQALSTVGQVFAARMQVGRCRCGRLVPHYNEGRPGILFVATRPSVEPTPEMSDDELLGLLAEVYRGAPWVDQGRLLKEVRDPGAPWSEIARFFFNVASSGTMAAVDPGVWDARKVKRELEPAEPIALGFDGSHAHDGTALIGCTQDGHLFVVELLERPEKAGDDWRIDRSRIHQALEQAMTTYDCQYVYCDPWTWQSELEEWAERWPNKIVELPTNSNRRMPELVDRFRTDLEEGRITHDGDPALRRHVLNARLRKVGRDEDGRGRFALEKAGPGRLIDGAVAAVLANEARAQIVAPTGYVMVLDA
jgi:hypothetical protein